MEYISNSLDQTIKIASDFVKTIKPGSTILAYGDLGAGKTAFGKGLGLGLGITKIINSPTFNILKIYKGKDLYFYHIDAYRLENEDETSNIGLDEVIGNKEGICYIEWPMYISQYLKDLKDIYFVKLEYIDENCRKIAIEEGYYHE